MANPTPKISDTSRAMLTLASTRPDRLVRPPQLPTAAARQVVRSLLNNGLAEEVPAPIEDAAYAWRTSDDAMVLMLRATDAGLAVTGASPDHPATIETFMQQVIGFLAEEDCNATILEEAEPRAMVADGFALGRSAASVAGDILAWLVETEAGVEEAAATATTGATEEAATTGADTAEADAVAREADAVAREADAVAREAAAIADALDAAPTARATAALDATTPDATAGTEARHDAPSAPHAATLRRAAQAVLDAWTDEANREIDIIAALEAPMAALQAALAGRTMRAASTTPRPPRAGTKQATVLTLLRRDEGASIAQIIDATGWQSHTVRGFLAGLKQKGLSVAVLERVRVASPGKEGAKGSYSVYRIA